MTWVLIELNSFPHAFYATHLGNKIYKLEQMSGTGAKEYENQFYNQKARALSFKEFYLRVM